jgi:hypothetical protein
MKAPIVSAILAVAALRSCALAVITLPIARIPQDSSQLRRRDSITEILGNNETGGWYTAEASVGTPAQKITFQIDTGSSDVWALSSTADLCTDAALQRQLRGGCVSPCESIKKVPFCIILISSLVETKKSSTFRVSHKDGFSIQYVDKEGSSGNYIQDNFAMGGATIKGLEMGIAYNTTVSIGRNLQILNTHKEKIL